SNPVRCTAPTLLYLTRDPWPWGQPHEAAGIHRTSRELGSRVAARGACAASGDAGDRLPAPGLALIARAVWGDSRELSAGLAGDRLRGGPKRHDGISWGGRTIR